MTEQLHDRGSTRHVTALTVAVGLAFSSVVGLVASPAGAVVGPSGLVCFEVSGSPGDAAVVNVTPVGASAAGFGLLISSDVADDPPVASNVNFAPGTVDPNVAVATIGADNEVCYQNSEGVTVEVIADHLGTIAGSGYMPATSDGSPDRVLDTRVDPIDVRPECDTPSTTGYDTSTAHTMFGLASRAYEVEPGVAQSGELLDDIGSGTVHFPAQMSCWQLVAALRGEHPALGAVTDTEVFVARNVDTHDLVVSFRGTEIDLADILNDISAARIPWTLPDGQQVANAVHGGFGAAYLAVRDQLLTVLSDERSAGVTGSRVFFTGHSLGGALATLGSIDLVDELMGFGYERTEVVTYTFGAPRSLSREMSGHHAWFVPVSFAVANPNDPVPHVPSAVGTTNPYSHIRNMAVLHSVSGSSVVRRNFGDGRDYGGCALLVPDLGDHARSEYHRRVGTTSYLSAPEVWLTTYAFVLLRMHWDSPIEGACDQVGLWQTSGTLTSAANPIRDRWVILDFNDQHSTTVNVGDDYWIGYIDMFGALISTQEFFPG